MVATQSAKDSVVLLVDDDADIRDLVAQALRTRQFEVALADDGAAALDWLAQHEPPCLILLDLMMPVMDGWQVLDRLQENERLAQVPVVITTAFRPEAALAARLPILRKPYQLRDLYAVVDRHCRGET
jgi:CheY-like chemotaxis protein